MFSLLQQVSSNYKAQSSQFNPDLNRLQGQARLHSELPSKLLQDLSKAVTQPKILSFCKRYLADLVRIKKTAFSNTTTAASYKWSYDVHTTPSLSQNQMLWSKEKLE